MSIGNLRPDVKYRLTSSSLERNVKSKVAEVVSVLDYGADPTGIINSEDAFSLALDENEQVYVPSGVYLIKNPIFITQSNRTLYGAGNSSIIKLDTSSFCTDSVALVGILQQNATIPASGSVELKIKWEYRSIASPHAGQISPVSASPGNYAAFLSPPNIILARNKSHPGSIAGISGVLTRNSDNQFIFTRNTTGTSTNVTVGTHRFDGQTITIAKGILNIVSIGYDSSNSYYVKNINIQNLCFRGISYQELSEALTQTVANFYTHATWIGKRRIPFYLFGAKTTQVRIAGCLFENNSYEGLWFANNNENTFYQVENNIVNDTGYEPISGSVLPAIQGNLSKSIISNNIVNRSGIGISASGDHLKVTNNQIHGFYGEAITWGDTDCKNIVIAENESFNTSTNLPVGAPSPTVTPVAYRGFYSGNNAPYKNMIIRGNTAHFQNTPGVGIKISSPYECLVTNNRIYFEDPTASSIGIICEPSTTNSTLTFDLDSNSVIFESLPANIFFYGIVAVPKTTNTIKVLLKNNYISGLTASNTYHFAFDIRDNAGGTIGLVSFNGDVKTAGQVRLINTIVSVDNNAAIHLAKSSNGTSAGNSLISAFFDSANSGTGNSGFLKSTTAPSTVGLVAGDIWYEMFANGLVKQIWTWNGSVWVSADTYFNNIDLSSITGSVSTNTAFRFTDNTNIMVTKIRVVGRVESAISPGGAIDSSANYYTFDVKTIAGAGATNNISGFTALSMQNRTYAQFTPVWLNSPDLTATVTVAPTGSEPDGSSTVARGWFINVTKQGSTSFNLIGFTATISFKLVRP